MAHKSLLDTESYPPDDDPPPSRAKAAGMNELMTAIEVIKSNYATREDLASIKANYATREDLASIKANYVTREDLASIMSHYATREELVGIMSRYITREELVSIMSRYATRDEVAILISNCATKEELAILCGKVDVLASHQQALQAALLAFQTHATQTFATKAELADAVYQLTWRMAAFAAATISATAAFVRYL